MSQTFKLVDILDSLVKEATLVRKQDGQLRCLACAHSCALKEGQRGICKVRFCKNGTIWAPYGYVAGVAVDPIEKKPFFHVLPGSDALTFGMLGCNFKCSYCQNWITSQSLKDPMAGASIQKISEERLVELALEYGAEVVVSSYNEPLISAEWAAAVFTLAVRQRRICAMVSNGYATKEVLEMLRPCMHAFKVDLKCFDEANYIRLGGILSKVLEGIRLAWNLGYWVEIVTLLVPGFNDSEQQLRQIANFIVSVSPDIPWHITAFHPDYKMMDRRPTSSEDLIRAANIGKEAGLKFVYAGNLPGRVGGLENTYCPECNLLLIERIGFSVKLNRIDGEGCCPRCGTKIPGIWKPLS